MNIAPTVSPVTKMGPPPAMTGGTLVEGTYVQTGYEYYNGETASGTHKDTLVFKDGTVKAAVSDSGKPDTIFAGTYSTSGNMLTMNISCPTPGVFAFTYTATPTTLVFISINSHQQGGDMDQAMT